MGAADRALGCDWLVCLVVSGHGDAPGPAELPEVGCRVAAETVAAGIALVAVKRAAVASAVGRVGAGCVGPHGAGPVAESVEEGEGGGAEGARGEGGAVEAADGAGGSNGEEVVKVAGQGLAVEGGGVEDPEVGGVARGAPPLGVAGGAVVGARHAGQHRAIEVLNVVEDEPGSTLVAVGGRVAIVAVARAPDCSLLPVVVEAGEGLAPGPHQHPVVRGVAGSAEGRVALAGEALVVAPGATTVRKIGARTAVASPVVVEDVP